MKTSERPTQRPGRTARHRPRDGYDHRWWGESPTAPSDPGASYWSATRRPLPCLVFILPFLAAYEAGVAWLGAEGGVPVRAGADAWMRRGLTSIGLTDRWLLPLALVLILVGWQAIDARRWRFHPGILGGMAFESLVLAVALIGLGRLLDLGVARLDSAPWLAAGGVANLVGFVGAGLYEETLFRLILIPLIYQGLRCLLTPNLMASTIAVTGAALLFSLAHHAGAPGEAFTWYAFIFRWFAGVFFAWVFLARGFGIAVGTHTAYDLLVGWLDWGL